MNADEQSPISSTWSTKCVGGVRGMLMSVGVKAHTDKRRSRLRS